MTVSNFEKEQIAAGSGILRERISVTHLVPFQVFRCCSDSEHLTFRQALHDKFEIPRYNRNRHQYADYADKAGRL